MKCRSSSTLLFVIFVTAVAAITFSNFKWQAYLNKSSSEELSAERITGLKEVRQFHIEKSLEREKMRLKTLEEQIGTIRHQLKESQIENEKLKDQLSSLTNETKADVQPISQSNSNGVLHERSKVVPLCNHLPQQIPHTMALWSDHLENIIEATKHPKDFQGSRFILRDFYSELLSMMTPDRLQRSVKSIPHKWDSIQTVMNIAYQRWAYLKKTKTIQNNKKDVEVPRRVKILTMGGSVLVGVQCRKLSFPYTIPRRECVYPYRLQLFLNNFFGEDIVEVHNVALGGTNSETGYTILNYDLLDEEMKNPDIIINGYSTNDMHVLTMVDAERSNQTLRDKVLEINQKIIRSVMKPPCDGNPHQSPPIYIHMDDYLGNEQRDILGTTQLSQAIHVLANHYGFLYISYADVLRDIVYGDTKELWFSPRDWYNGKTGEYQREIHPGMAMHITSTWLLAYNFLNIVTSYCSVAWAHEEEQHEMTSSPQNETEFEYKAINGLPKLKGRFKNEGKPKHFPRHGLPPELTKDLLLEHVSEKWRSEANAMESCHATTPLGTMTSNNRCIFSLMAGPFTKKMNNETYVREYWFRHVTSNEGWLWENDHDKLGFVPKKGGAEFTMDFPSSMVEQPINVVTLISMKSYGERWKDSTVKVTIGTKRSQTVITSNVEGFHAKNTSEIFPHEIHIPTHGVVVGDDLRINMKLIAGSTFKLVGLAICS